MIYLNNAATSHPKPQEVYAAVDGALRGGATSGRSAHASAFEGGRLLFETREKLGELLDTPHSDRFIFTANATESLNLALQGFLAPGDHCVTTSMEHNAMARPLRHLEGLGVEIGRVPCSPRGELHPRDVAAAFTPATKLLAITHASNVIGTLVPLGEIIREAHALGIPVLVDASQTCGSLPISIRDLGIDLLACPGHKGLLGPQGTGLLWLAPGIDLRPLRYGGTGSRSASLDMPDILPDRFEAGTPNLPGIAGLGAGVDFLLAEGPARIRFREVALCGRLLEGLAGIEGMELHGMPDPGSRAPVISFNIRGLDPSAVGDHLQEAHGVVSRVGLHCAPEAHRTLGTFPQGSVRLSPGGFNQDHEIDCVVEALRGISHDARSGSRVLQPAAH